MVVKTRTQKYAHQALECVDTLIKDKNNLAKEYKSRANGFSVMVMQAGLAQALGFLMAKSPDAAYAAYFDDLAKVLNAGGSVAANNGEALQIKVLAAPLAEYRLLTRETLLAAGWIKRFAQAKIKTKKEGENQ